jgi:hypothetical protein
MPNLRLSQSDASLVERVMRIVGDDNSASKMDLLTRGDRIAAGRIASYLDTVIRAERPR